MFIGIFVVAGQPEFESKDFHTQMRRRMIYFIQCDNFVGRTRLWAASWEFNSPIVFRPVEQKLRIYIWYCIIMLF